MKHQIWCAILFKVVSEARLAINNETVEMKALGGKLYRFMKKITMLKSKKAEDDPHNE